jgi:hypothetical protein
MLNRFVEIAVLPEEPVEPHLASERIRRNCGGIAVPIQYGGEKHDETSFPPE